MNITCATHIRPEHNRTTRSRNSIFLLNHIVHRFIKKQKKNIIRQTLIQSYTNTNHHTEQSILISSNTIPWHPIDGHFTKHRHNRHQPGNRCLPIHWVAHTFKALTSEKQLFPDFLFPSRIFRKSRCDNFLQRIVFLPSNER